MEAKGAPIDLSTQPLSTQDEDLGALRVFGDVGVLGYSYVVVTEDERIMAIGSRLEKPTVDALIDKLVLKYPRTKVEWLS